MSASSSQPLPQGLEALFTDLRPRSLLSLQMAVATQRAAGVGATLIVQIPASPDKACEIFLSTAPSSLVAELYKLAG